MANVLASLFTDIASAIRNKTGESNEIKMKPAEFPQKIASISSGNTNLLENVSITPDFSQGNQTVTTDDNEAIKSAIIIKPDALTPSNIKKDVIIAGVTGSLEVGNSAEINFYGMTFANMQYTIAGTVTTAAGPGNMKSIMKSSIPSAVTHIVAIPADEYEYSTGCIWDWLGGHWVYDYRVHNNETFDVPYSGTAPSWECIDIKSDISTVSNPIILTYTDSDHLEFKAYTSQECNFTLRLFNSSGTIATYKVIIG